MKCYNNNIILGMFTFLLKLIELCEAEIVSMHDHNTVFWNSTVAASVGEEFFIVLVTTLKEFVTKVEARFCMMERKFINKGNWTSTSRLTENYRRQDIV